MGLKSEEFIVFGGGSKKRQVLLFPALSLFLYVVLLQFVTQGLSLSQPTARAAVKRIIILK